MKPISFVALLSSALIVCASPAWSAQAGPAPTEPFDYFQNSWNVIGLKDYKDGTRVTPQNELLLAKQVKVRLSCGPKLTPLSRKQTKTLLEGWLPVILLNVEEEGVHYEFKLWATPLPTVKDWRAAFNWPTEGENFLNWIQVKATNRGRSASEARVQLDRLGSNAVVLATWTKPLKAGASAEMCFRIPYVPVADMAVFEKESPDRWLDRTVRYWRELLAGGARLEVPCAKATATLRAAHVCQLIANDHGVMHAGEGFYDEFYIRDGGYQLLEFEEAGLWDAARKGMAPYLKSQRPDGRFESQAGQLDANGQALWTLWQYWKITADQSWLREVFPPMRRAGEWIVQARRQAPSDPAFAGLLPPAVADGEFLWAGKNHIVGYDLWNLRGLLCVADAARALGEQAQMQRFEAEAAAYRKDIDAALQRAGLAYFPPSWEKAGTPWGNTETIWPTELFAPNDPRVIGTMAEVRERHGGGFVEGTIRWTGLSGVIHPYLSSYTTMASLIRGEHEKFAEEFYWYLLHSTASHAFPEGVYFKRRNAWSDTIPHALGAANYTILLRHALVHEQGAELHLLLGAPDWWFEPGREIKLENAPTHFGPMSLVVRGTAAGVSVKVDLPKRQPPQQVFLHLPANRPPAKLPAQVAVARRSPQSRRWDFPAGDRGLSLAKSGGRQAHSQPGAATLATPVAAAQCRFLDLATLANTDPRNAPFGILNPGKYVFTGLVKGNVTAEGVPFRVIDPSENQGRALVVLHGESASSQFPREVVIPVGEGGRRLHFLGNVHGYSAEDEGVGEWGAVAEYVIHYTDGQIQSVPLINHRTADDWALPPDATQAQAVVKGDPWHLNLLVVDLRPVAVERIVFRDLGTPAAPVLAAVTLEK